MPSALNKQLTKTSILWALWAIATVLIVVSDLVKYYWQLELVDGISNPDQARLLVTALTENQRTGHIWFTATIDVLLPFFVALMLVSVTLKHFPKYGRYLAIPPLLAVPIDYFEGVIQLLVLTDTVDLLVFKAYSTPVKIGGYLFGLVVSIMGLLKWSYRKLTLVMTKQPIP